MKQLFYFYGYRLKVIRWNHGKIIAAKTFEPKEEGFEEFSNFIKGYQSIKTQMLVDIIEEDFQSETIPRVNSRDRKGLIERNLDKYFRDVKYRCALHQGRQKTGRKDDIYLLGALTNADLITPWVDKIREEKVNLIGIQSVSTVGEKLISKIGHDGDPTLLVTQQLPWTIRLSFYENERLLFSRLIPTRIDDASEYPPLVFNEIEQTLRYLKFKRLLSADEDPHVIIVSSDEYHQQTEAVLTSSESFDYTNLSVKEVARKIGVKYDLDSPCADSIFAHIAETKTVNHYGQDDDLKIHKSLVAKNNFYISGAITVAASIICCLGLLINGYIYSNTTITAREKTDELQRKYEQKSQELNEALTNAGAMKQAVDAIGNLSRDEMFTPLEMTTVISNAISKEPNIKLEKLEIKFGDKNNEAAIVDPLAVPPVPADGSDIIIEENSNKPKPVISIEARLVGLEKNYRESLKTVNRFIGRIKGSSSTKEVTLTKPPVDFAPKAQISGSTGLSQMSTNEESNHTRFTIDVEFRKSRIIKPKQKDSSLSINKVLSTNNALSEKRSGGVEP